MLGINTFLYALITSVLRSLDVLTMVAHCAVYFSLYAYSVSVFPKGLTLTPIVLMEVDISPRLIGYVVVYFPCVNDIFAGLCLIVAICGVPCSSQIQSTRYQKHLGRARFPPVECSFCSKSCAISSIFGQFFREDIVSCYGHLAGG